jgi:steroid delta-isomerase-like uncharacterized protein
MLDPEKFLEERIEHVVEQAWNKGNVDALDEVLLTDFAYKAPLGVDLEGLDAFKQHILSMRIAYPDLHVKVNEATLDQEHNTVFSEWTFEGTNVGDSEFMGHPVTGKKLLFKGVSLIHIEDDQYADEVDYYDALEVMRKLGLVPEMAA